MAILKSLIHGLEVKALFIMSNWRFCGGVIPAREIVFFSQIIVVYFIIGASIYNLSIENDRPVLWTSLLSSSIGYILPNPALKVKKHVLVNNEQ